MKKKVMLIGIIIILILLATFGASVALFNGVRTGSSLSSIKVGDLTFKYTEVTGVGNGISLEDADAISDAEGKGLTTWFDFKIDANLVNSDMIYEVSVEPTSDTTINLDGVKIYLSRLDNDVEKDIYTNYDGAGKVKVISDYDNGIIYQERILKNTKNYEKNFRVRIWISEDVDIYTDGYMGTIGAFKINVNARSDISMVDAGIPVPQLTGGTGTTWTTALQTISVTNIPVLSNTTYEYVITHLPSDIPNDLTLPTGTTENEYVVSDIGMNYIYYRTVGTNNQKSAWSLPQIVYYDNNTYTITYNLNGGTQGENPVISYNVETPKFILPKPTQVGYEFAGWYDNPEFTGSPVTQLNPGTRGNKTYYAKWTANTYTVTLNNQSATTSGTTSVTATYDSDVPTITVPTRTGYTFGGYYTSTNGDGEKYINDDGTSAKTWNITDAIVLYAKWTVNTYILSLDGNGGTISETTGYTIGTNGDGFSYATKVVTYDSTYGTLPTPTRTGYNFSGWYNAVTIGTRSLVESSGNYNYYELKYNIQPGETYTITMDSATRTAGTATKFAILIYDFTSNTRLASVHTDFGNNRTIAIECPTTADRNHKLRIIIYAGINGSTANNAVTYTNVKLGTMGTTSASLYTSTSKVETAHNHQLHAIWSAIQSTITLDNQSATTSGTASITAAYDSQLPKITIPTKTGYTFDGYYTSTNGGGTKYINVDGTSARNWDKTSATTLYAHWIANKYTVKFNGNGSTSGSMSDQSFTYGTAQALTTNGFQKQNYTFAGWATSSTATTVNYTNKQSVSNLTATTNGTVNLYAIWVQTAAYTFNYNGTTGSDGSIQTFKAPVTGYYKLEVWGAQGGTGGSYRGGYGGYSIGVAKLTGNSTYYVVVGGQGGSQTSSYAGSTAGGYNGGGYGYSQVANDLRAGGGGGATHIATTTGLLSSLSSSTNQAKVLIAAGGGAGGYGYGSSWWYGNSGGGFEGVYSYNSSTRGTQTSGYKFGQASDATSAADTSTNHSGGGGGWWGGLAAWGEKGAGGGSGYIGNSLLLTRNGVTKQMYCYNCTASTTAATKTTSTTNVSGTATANYAKSGHGYAKITWITVN